MKKIIPATLTILLLIFANSAMADRGSDRGNRDGYVSKGKRVEKHLKARGDRIDRHFDRKAVRAYEKGKYRHDGHFQKKGKHNHKRFEHRGDYRRHNHLRGRSYPQVAYPVKSYRHPNTHVSVFIQQPGFLLGWGIHR